MQINWAMISCFVILFFVISGFSRGWWKEAITTIALALFVFFLQNPDWAEAFINYLNNIIAAVWSLIPSSIITAINGFTEEFFGFSFSTGPFQFDPTSGGTWLTLLLLFVGVSILVGRASLRNQPVLLGKLLGAVVGGINGLLIINLIREYMDGRALPGGEASASTSGIVIASSNTYGPPAATYALQFTNLPNYTILDSIIPWVLIGIGALLLFSVFKTRLIIDTDNEGGKKLLAKAPPFYKKPPPPSADPIRDSLSRLLGSR